MEYADKYCDVIAINGYLNTYPISFALSKNHPLLAEMTRAMVTIQNNGKLNQILRHYEQFQCGTKKKEKTPASLFVSDVAGLFCVVGLKLVFAILWFSVVHSASVEAVAGR